MKSENVCLRSILEKRLLQRRGVGRENRRIATGGENVRIAKTAHSSSAVH